MRRPTVLCNSESATPGQGVMFTSFTVISAFTEPGLPRRVGGMILVPNLYPVHRVHIGKNSPQLRQGNCSLAITDHRILLVQELATGDWSG